MSAPTTPQWEEPLQRSLTYDPRRAVEPGRSWRRAGCRPLRVSTVTVSLFETLCSASVYTTVAQRWTHRVPAVVTGILHTRLDTHTILLGNAHHVRYGEPVEGQDTHAATATRDTHGLHTDNISRHAHDRASRGAVR